MRRRFMFASALVSLTVLAPVAYADRDVTDEITDPLATSTAGDGGGADNIVISSTGRVTLTSAVTPAVTLDSDNTIENDGIISVTTDDDGGVGVHIVGGNTGSFTNSGTIQVESENPSEDTDGDGDLDGPTAVGGNRIAILVDGSAVFTGDIILATGSSIIVKGNDSSGIRVLTGIDGSLIMNGQISIAGDRSTGVDVRSDISNDISVNTRISTIGWETQALSVTGNVGGGISIGGSLSSTGYQFNSIPTASALETLDEDDLRQGGSAFYLSGSVAEGIFIAGPTSDDPNISEANISVRGQAPAVHIQASSDSGNIVLGEVVIAAIPDDPDTTDDESQPEQFLGYSFVNRGIVASTGELVGVSTNALRIEGGAGFTTTLSDGLLNEGNLSATSLSSSSDNATSTTVSLGSNVIIPVWTNAGDIRSTSFGEGGLAQGISIEAGASLSSLNNESLIFVQGLVGGQSIAVIDRSGTLNSVQNSGVISALSTVPEGSTDAAGSTIALDLSYTSNDTTVHQYRRADDESDASIAIVGDVMFGSGNDQLVIESGGLTGAISFGDGSDQLLLSGGGTVSGQLSDSDGDLSIQVDGSTLELASGPTSNIREARFGDGSRLIFQIDHEAGIAANISASETVTFESGSRISTSLTNLIGDGATYVILSANSLVIEETIEALEDTVAPYLYETSIDFDPNDSNSLILTMRRRTADELSMNTNQGQAYAAAYAGWQSNAELGSAIAGLTTESEFFNAYNQLLPEYAASAIQFALASNDSAVGALSTRLEAVRRSPENSAGLWVQEFSYFADRAGSSSAPGYRGQGMGLAVGVDRPFGPFYAAGVNFIGSASEISEADGLDDPMSAISGQVGLYAGAELAGLNLDLYSGAGIDSFEHNRRVLIGTFEATPTSEWTGYHFAASARLGRDFQAGRYYFRPSVSVDYLSLFESAYTENGGGDGIDLVIDDRESTNFSTTALLTLGARFENRNSWWAPHARLGFRNELGGSEVETLARFDGYDETFTLRSQQLPGTGFIFGFGIGAGSGYSTFSFDYDADIRDDFIRHTARIVMRMVF